MTIEVKDPNDPFAIESLLIDMASRQEPLVAIAISIIESGAFNQPDMTINGEVYGNAVASAAKTIYEKISSSDEVEQG